MNSTQAKKFIASALPKGTTLAARTVSKRFIEVRIRPEPAATGFCPLTYSAAIPVSICQAAIKAVYPNTPKLHEQTACGNISASCICISPEEWDLVSAAYFFRL